MIRQTVLIDLRVRARSGAGLAALLLLLLALAVAIVLCFRVLGQQPAPTVNYGGYGLSGFGRTPTTADAPSGFQPSLSSLTSASRGLVVLIALAGVLAVGGSLIGALLGSGTIAGEYERETIDLALTTQLGAGGLTTLKLLTTFLYCLLLALAMLPAFGFLLVFSAVPASSLAMAAAIVLGSLLCGSSIGVFFSATLRSSVAAFLSAAAVSMLLSVGGGAAYLLLTQFSGNPPILTQLLLIPSPVAALLSTTTNQLQGSSAIFLPALLHASPAHPVHLAGHWQMPLPFWTLTLAVDLGVTATLLLLSGRSIRGGTLPIAGH